MVGNSGTRLKAFFNFHKTAAELLQVPLLHCCFCSKKNNSRIIDIT